MAQENFEQCTSWILIHEGGYVNHPKDPGGATNRGVIQRTYDGYRRRKGLPTQSVRQITDDEVHDIYRSQYWNAVEGDMLPSGLDYAMYDFAINSGPKRAIQFLQNLLGVTADGHIGQVTLGAIAGKNNIVDLVMQLCSKRYEWLQKLKTFSTFGRGWTTRVMGDIINGAQPGRDHGVIDRGVWLAQGQTVISTPVFIPEANHKADEEDLKLTEVTKQSFNLENMAKISGGVIPGAIASAAALPDGPLQWATAAVAVIAAVVVGFLVVRKLS